MTEIESRLEGVLRIDQPALVFRRELASPDVRDWDSLNNVRLIVAVENEFKVRFRTPDIVAIRNVGELADLIVKRQA